MQSKVQRWGNSLAVRIPKTFASDIGLAEDSPVEISIASGELVITPAKPRFTLERLLAGITDENRHDAVETGEAVGDEVW